MPYSIVPLFSVPILYQPDSNRILTITERSIIDKLNRETGPNNFTTDNHILNTPGLDDLKKFCQAAIDTYAREVCKVSDEFYITNSWATKNEQGIQHHRHTHPNSIFSGVFYFDADQCDAPLTLHAKSPIFKNFALEYHYSGYSIYNSNNWSFPVKTGTLIIFPSWVEHGSLENKNTKSRQLIGFNSFVKGKFGDYNYCSDLIIA